MYEVTIKIEFCYGHRIQNHPGKCCWLHGHSGLLEVTVGDTQLNHHGMVMDFTDLKQHVRAWINEHMDHAMILARADPLVSPLERLGQRLYLMEQAPTAENMLKEIYAHLASQQLNIMELKLWENASNCATYRMNK